MKQLQLLLKRYLKGAATEKEVLFVERYTEQFAEQPNYSHSLTEEEKQSRELANWKRLKERIRQQPASRVVTMFRGSRKWIAAASVLLLIVSGSVWIMKEKSPSTPKSPVAAIPEDVLPGKDGAILTLANGSQLVLDKMGNGVIASQSGSRIVLNNNEVTYSTVQATKGDPVQYNTLTTPRGRQFHIRLPDGTGVWLNAESTIRYPTIFTGNERKVVITGEAYFEVAKDRSKPFLVDINNKAIVEVLGTQFNIHAYPDELNVETTLLEGSISMRNNKQSLLLKPSQQALLSNGNMQLIADADIRTIMAWKHGSFRFKNASLEDVLRQLSRWYDVEVSYKYKGPQRAFTGAIKRNFTLSEALKVLEVLGVTFNIEGKHVIVNSSVLE